MIEKVIWPVPGTREPSTRPEHLIAALSETQFVSVDAPREFHRRGPGKACFASVGRAGHSTAVLSPAVLATTRGEVAWIDLNDDWTLAPDLKRIYRAAAFSGYRRLRSAAVRARLVTTNTSYMAGKVAPARALVVPNGVDPALAHMRLGGDGVPRLLLMGNFFKGRTDFALMRDLLLSTAFEEVVVANPGSNTEVADLLARARTVRGPRLSVEPWLTPTDIAALAGEHTVGAIPHVVKDYTVSQDSMKVYQWLALGMRVICPRLLWPSALPVEPAFLVEYGVDLTDDLAEWVVEPSTDQAWRERFVRQHSWSTRAAVIANALAARV